MVGLQSLPRSLQARVAQVEFQGTINRNMHLFNNCNLQFLQRFMTTLTEVSLMPDELVIKHGDMARELSFAVKGTLVVTDSKGVLIELLSGDGTAPCVTGAVSFFLGEHLKSAQPPSKSIVLHGMVYVEQSLSSSSCLRMSVASKHSVHSCNHLGIGIGIPPQLVSSACLSSHCFRTMLRRRPGAL